VIGFNDVRILKNPHHLFRAFYAPIGIGLVTKKKLGANRNPLVHFALKLVALIFTWSGPRGVDDCTEVLAAGEADISVGPVRSLAPYNLHDFRSLE
jgi:hypothetical protein